MMDYNILISTNSPYINTIMTIQQNNTIKIIGELAPYALPLIAFVVAHSHDDLPIFAFLMAFISVLLYTTLVRMVFELLDACDMDHDVFEKLRHAPNLPTASAFAGASLITFGISSYDAPHFLPIYFLLAFPSFAWAFVCKYVQVRYHDCNQFDVLTPGLLGLLIPFFVFWL